MAQLAIRGHATRGKEIIEILKMFGGKNDDYHVYGSNDDLYYYIATDGYIYGSDINYKDFACKYIIFTIEEFLEKFPYKVGDKVQHKGATSCGSVLEVENMRWDEDTVKYTLRPSGCNDIRSILPAEHLQPYKEAPMYLNEKANKQAEEIAKILKPAKEIMEEMKLDIPDGYEFFGVSDGKIVLTKKQSLYLKTYKACCGIIGAKSERHYFYTKKDKEDCPHEVKLLDCLDFLRRLLICRDAYWQIAGDWKYDVNKTEEYFYIVNKGGRIVKEHYMNFNHILAFPTAEMRDAFYEDFKELIELCKELL